jgi:Spy/CpxP family protein refolding chaperone
MWKIKLLFTLLFLTLTFSASKAQNVSNVQKQQFNEPERPQLLRELGLKPDQIRQIKMINGENRDKMREANFRLRQARNNLDAAIYANNADPALVETRLREFQNAQAEVAGIRTMTEFAIRQILTPEQLVKFRELRERFEQFRQNRRQLRRGGMPPPKRGFSKGQKPPQD